MDKTSHRFESAQLILYSKEKNEQNFIFNFTTEHVYWLYRIFISHSHSFYLAFCRIYSSIHIVSILVGVLVLLLLFFYFNFYPIHKIRVDLIVILALWWRPCFYVLF